MDDRIILGLAEHAYTIDYFSSLPTDIKCYIQTFYKSRLPNVICPKCGKLFYIADEFGFLGTHLDCYACIRDTTRWGMWSYKPNENLIK